MAIEPVGFILGLVLIAAGIGNLVRREEVAKRLARAYEDQKSPSWFPKILSQRFGIRETRVVSVLVAILLLSVGCWFVIDAL